MPFQGRLETTPLLELLQILAYSRKSGTLVVESGEVRGEVIFQDGNVVGACSPGSLPLLVQAAKETESSSRFSLRRTQVVASLRELLDWSEGDYRFVGGSHPVPELEGLDIKMFYRDGAFDTGDLLVTLEKAMEDEAEIARAAPPAPADFAHKRQHERFGPIILHGDLAYGDTTLSGLLTNLSLGGTFFHADEVPPLDCTCELRFTLPDELGRCQTRAKVVWLRSEGANIKKGAGLAFEPLDPDTEQKILAYLKWFQNLATELDFQV